MKNLIIAAALFITTLACFGAGQTVSTTNGTAVGLTAINNITNISSGSTNIIGQNSNLGTGTNALSSTGGTGGNVVLGQGGGSSNGTAGTGGYVELANGGQGGTGGGNSSGAGGQVNIAVGGSSATGHADGNGGTVNIATTSGANGGGSPGTVNLGKTFAPSFAGNFFGNGAGLTNLNLGYTNTPSGVPGFFTVDASNNMTISRNAYGLTNLPGPSQIINYCTNIGNSAAFATVYTSTNNSILTGSITVISSIGLRGGVIIAYTNSGMPYVSTILVPLGQSFSWQIPVCIALTNGATFSMYTYPGAQTGSLGTNLVLNAIR